ncbi:Uncharacterised protein [Streptococcus constellatus]|uniref:DUF1697 domain-containing protein n=1 Tax=Streptococcus constellatus TaxID=76860 RepID=A0A564SU41_STRCV|nr:DUF1697 domain-containing protein [Streptococcus constellatus]VUW98599.1 Uncharacterised protein [Streptococcus constellatus]VUX06816.1 Uncharacterised protein [Streptococcus gordonii]
MKSNRQVQYLALLRGVMPTGPNRIPKMSDLVQMLEQSGLDNVSSYIQSGNVICKTSMSAEELAQHIHQLILEKIGANLSIIIKEKSDLEKAVLQNPFPRELDQSRIHLLFTNNVLSTERLKEVAEVSFTDEIFVTGETCLYMYLPKDARKKKLNNNFLEKKLGIVATTRKLSVIKELTNRMD